MDGDGEIKNKMASELLTREQFRERVLTRDNYKCVLCPKPAEDAHHIIDRSLFADGGYYLNNGVSLCKNHHLDAEQTIISCETLRLKAGISEIILPEHFETDNFETIERFDHWGNIILPSGIRVKGELFYQDNVQKILGQAGIAAGLFLNYIKYPRTYHAPWSPNVSKDDRMHSSMTQFLNRNLIITEKKDGENFNLYTDYSHARSINSGYHPSRSWIKAFHAKIAHEIPKGWRFCGENLFAKHSIHYKHLKSYFYLYSIWNDKNVALNWEDTMEWASLLGIHPVPVIHTGSFSSVEEMKTSIEEAFGVYSKNSKDEVEGYVIRIADAIPYKDFRVYTAKVVRKDHVQTHGHWMRQVVIQNVVE